MTPMFLSQSLTRRFFVAMAMLISMAGLHSASFAAEYFVSLQGDDANDGKTMAQAFASIQKGVDTLTPGDTLTIAPGEYHQSARRDKLGSADAMTTIRAAIPGTVLLRGDVRLPAFTAVSGKPFVYVADFKAPEAGLQAVIEQDTRTIFEPMPNLNELSYGPARFHYDDQAGKLYISTSDWKAASTHTYTAAVIPTHGLFLSNATKVHVHGLTFTGFMASFMQARQDNSLSSTWGLFLDKPINCVVSHVTAYLNGTGIGMNSHAFGTGGFGGNLIEYCTAFTNASAFTSGDVGGITVIMASNDRVEHSTSFLNRGYGINFYLGNTAAQKPENKSTIADSITWGNTSADVKIKTGVDDLHTTERTVAYYPSNDYDPAYCLVGSARTNDRGFSGGNIAIDAEENLDFAAEFADPIHHDYRLQATSRFRGQGPDGTDRGPNQYQANVHFVGDSGNDAADGLSVQHAWKTLAHALASLKPGDTLYLLPGTYSEDVTINTKASQDKPVNIRGRGDEAAVITGKVTIAGASHVTLQRLQFQQPVAVTGSSAITLDNSKLSGGDVTLQVRNTQGLKVTHTAIKGFAQAAIDLSGSSDAHLAGNVLDNAKGVGVRVDDLKAVHYADYNVYRNADNAWAVKGQSHSTQSLSPSHERNSGVMANDGQAAFMYMGRSAGTFRDQLRDHSPRLATEPVVHSVSSTTANIQWFTSSPATNELAWGTTPDCENKARIVSTWFGSYSLTGLEPGKTYHFRVDALRDAPGAMEVVGVKELSETSYPAMSKGKTLTFTTPARDEAGRTLYVSTQGSDDNDGLSDSSAWRTLAHAARQVQPGDTVLIAAGQYDERVHLHATGSADAPITFKAMPGQRVTLTGADKQINTAFLALAKHHLRFDGLYFKDYAFWNSPPGSGLAGQSALFNLQSSSDIDITRCFADGRGGYPPQFVSMWKSSDVLIKNSVAINHMGCSIGVWRSPDVRIENYVSVRPLIKTFVFNNAPDQKITVSHSILTDMLQKKADLNTSFMELEEMDSLTMDHVAIYLRTPAQEREFINVVNHAQRKVLYSVLIPQLDSRGWAGMVIVDNPLFAGSDTSKPYKVDDMADPRVEVDFDDFFTTHPQLVAQGIGLQPSAFDDYAFKTH